MYFEGVDCASCTESLESRIGRLRGVESAKVDSSKGTLTISLAEQNRVRVEQIRDFVEQGGSKTKRAVVRVKGELATVGGKWVLQPAQVPSTYEIVGSKLSAGTKTVNGEIEDLRPAAGPLRIAAESAR